MKEVGAGMEISEMSNELIDRYLNAVKFWLPKESKDDIVRELSENLHAQMEDKVEELGRPLSEDEQAAILKQHGNPMLAASRYWPRQHLIGPGLFTVYSFVLKVAIGLAIAGSLVAHLVAETGGDLTSKILAAFFVEAPNVALITFAWVTIVFAAIDFAQTRFKSLEKWDPRSLPRTEKARKRSSRFEQVCELAASCVGIAWWILIPRYPFLLFGPAAQFMSLTPAWGTLYVPVIILAGISALMHYTRLIRPDLSWLRQTAEIGGQAMALVAISLMLKAGPLIALHGNADAGIAKVADALNLTIRIALEIGSVIAMVQLLWSVVKLIRSLPFLFGTKEVML
jgi:hypothetical protein